MTDARLSLKKKLRDLDPYSSEYQRVNARQLALKILINAMYGQLGYHQGIFYTRSKAAEVTRRGREILKQMQKLVGNKGFTVLAVDTDGLLLHFNPNQNLIEFANYINAQLPFLIRLEVESVWSASVIHKAKNYILYDAGRNELIIKGSAFKSKRYCLLSRETVRRAIREFFQKGSEVSACREVLFEARERLLSGDFGAEDVCRRATLTMEPSQYKDATTEHLVAAKLLEERLGVRLRAGMEVEYFFVRGKGLKSIRATPIQFFDPTKVDVEDVLVEVYKVVGAFIAAACCLKGRKEALGVLTHIDLAASPVTNTLSKPERVEVPVQPAQPKSIETELPSVFEKPEPSVKSNFGCIVQLPFEKRMIYRYEYDFKRDYGDYHYPCPPADLDFYLTYTEAWIIGVHVYFHLIDIDEGLSEADYRKIVVKLRPFQIISYTSTVDGDRFRCHILIPFAFDGSSEEKYAIKRFMRKKVQALGIPDCPGNTSTWCRLPLFMYGLSNHSTKNQQEIRFIQKLSLEEIRQATFFNRRLIEPDVKSSISALLPPRAYMKMFPCIDKIMRDPYKAGQAIAGIEDIRHACYISTVWFFARYNKVSLEDAKIICLTFADGMRYDEFHTSTAEYQFNYGYDNPFAIDCEALESGGFCDENCPKRKWKVG